MLKSSKDTILEFAKKEQKPTLRATLQKYRRLLVFYTIVLLLLAGTLGHSTVENSKRIAVEKQLITETIVSAGFTVDSIEYTEEEYKVYCNKDGVTYIKIVNVLNENTLEYRDINDMK